MAEGEGFEPPVRLSGGQPISSRPRYDRFGIPPCAKELSKEVPARFGEETPLDLDLMVGRQAVGIAGRAQGPPFLIIAAEDDPSYPRLLNCPGAHETRLLRDEKRAAEEPVVLYECGSLGHGQKLGVGEGGTAKDGKVVSPAYDLVLRRDNEGPHRHFAGSISLPGFFQAHLHEHSVLHVSKYTFRHGENQIKGRMGPGKSIGFGIGALLFFLSSGE
jgi:hypothetical protein